MTNPRPIVIETPEEISLDAVPYTRESSRTCKKMPPNPTNNWLQEMGKKSATKREHELYKAPVEMPVVEDTVELVFDTNEVA